jgi:hypothetical protein
MRDAVLFEAPGEDGDPPEHDLAITARVLDGDLTRNERVIAGDLRLVPFADDSIVYVVEDRATGDALGVINARPIATGAQLVRDLVAIAEGTL